MFFLYCTILCYFIVNVKPRVTEMNKWFIFFINIISVQFNQSALLNVLKKIKVNLNKNVSISMVLKLASQERLPVSKCCWFLLCFFSARIKFNVCKFRPSVNLYLFPPSCERATILYQRVRDGATEA